MGLFKKKPKYMILVYGGDIVGGWWPIGHKKTSTPKKYTMKQAQAYIDKGQHYGAAYICPYIATFKGPVSHDVAKDMGRGAVHG